MKKFSILFIALIAAITSIFANPLKPNPVVDERTELMSIVFRLAGAEEYTNDAIKIYTKDIGEHFKAFKDHELIKWVPELRKQYGIGYDAVMSYAIHLVIEDNKLSFIKNMKENDLDSRWTSEVALQFLEKLNDFYRKSKFNEFYVSHKALYSIAEERFTKVLDLVNFDWFEKYYGVKPEGNFNLIISLTNGGGNYGPKINYSDGTESLFAIMGSWAVDSAGNPTYSPRVLETVVHEYNHSFCNPLADEFYPQMKEINNEFFRMSEAILRRQAYGNPNTLLREIMVRASVIQYYKEAGGSPEEIERMVMREKQRGFIWIDKLCDKLSEYERNRDKYSTLKSFMPEIVKLQNSLSPEKEMEEYKAKAVKIISTSIPNGATGVDPNTKLLTVTFDKPMNTRANGSSYGKKGEKFFPKFTEGKKASWNENNKKEWTIYIELEPNKEYSISFPSQFFVGEKGEPLLETYFLDFKTAKQ